MKFDTLSRRAAAVGAVTALAGGVLVGTATMASATTQPATNEYMCTAPNPTQADPNATTTFPVWLTASAPNLAGFPQFYAGAAIPAAVQVSNHFSLPTAAVQALGAKHIDSVNFPDLGAVFSGTDVVVGESGTPQEDGTIPAAPSALVANMTASATPGLSEFDADGQNKALTAPVAGDYQLLNLGTFTIGLFAGDVHAADANCVLFDETASSLHDITLVQNKTTGTAKSAKKSYKKGSTAKVIGTFTANNVNPSGTVTLVNKAGKKLASAKLNDLGKATLATNKLPVGKNKLNVVYKGNGYTTATKAPVTVTVVK